MKLVILDRDDTLIRVPLGRRYLYGDDEIVLADGAEAFLRRLADAGVIVVLATNQQGVALAEYPDMTVESVDRFHERLQEKLNSHGAKVARVYVCPHSADAGCVCRKPRPGLFLQAMRDFSAAPEETAAMGDRRTDLEAARAAGIESVFLINHDGIGATTQDAGDLPVISSFDECIDRILA